MNNQSFPQPGVLPKNPKLSVCMIVRDEEEILPRCLKSVQDVADELIVVDTGSKDNTISIAKDFGAKVFHFKWCDDFAAARNEYLKHATGDWILVIDADEELLSDSKAYLRDALLRPTVIYYLIKCDNGPECLGPRFTWFDRLFRRHPKVRYHRPCHAGVDGTIESLILAEPRWQKQFEPNIIIRHYGYEPSKMPAKWDRRLRIIKSYLRKNPNDGYLLARLGEAYFGLGCYDEAEVCLKKAVDIDSDSSETNYSLGVTLQKQGKLDEAIQYYHKAIANDPGLSDAYGNLGSIYIQKGMFDSAISVLKTALAIEPEKAMGHNMLGLAYNNMGMFDEAITQYKRALKIDPNNADAHFNLGVAYGNKGMTNEDIIEYKHAVALKPDYAEAHNNLAVAYYLEGQYELAIQHCDKAIELGLKVHPEFLEELKAFR